MLWSHSRIVQSYCTGADGHIDRQTDRWTNVSRRTDRDRQTDGDKTDRHAERRTKHALLG